MLKVLCLLFPLFSWSQDSVRGERLYGACRDCHGDRGEGSLEQKVPRVGGQHDWYIVDALKGFEKGLREEIERAPHKGLGEQDIKDLVAYISGLLTTVEEVKNE